MSRKRRPRAANRAKATASEPAKELEARVPVTVLDNYDFSSRKPAASWRALVASA